MEEKESKENCDKIKNRQADTLLELAQENVSLFHDDVGDGYAVIAYEKHPRYRNRFEPKFLDTDQEITGA